ncbi:MAG: phage integrase N-terminal SAM-like domain-containing protein, partial [Calditrichia bacterium]|nr:phage integrase N-terminal SAM-like domain-containing protein [Calditrichia bacterium]
HYHKSPDQINEEELRKYFLHNKNIKKWSRTASTISICGIKFFYSHTLKKDWTTFNLVRPPKEKKLPHILSIDEVRKILANIKMYYHPYVHYLIPGIAIFPDGKKLISAKNAFLIFKICSLYKAVFDGYNEKKM